MSEKLKNCDAELVTTLNKISRYSDKIVTTIEKYIGYLEDLVSMGIKDEQICAQIENLKVLIEPFRKAFDANMSQLNSKTYKLCDELETIDKFKYSDDNMSSIMGVLAAFL